MIATGPMAAHQALLFRQLSDRVTVVLHDPEVDADGRGGASPPVACGSRTGRRPRS